MTRSNIMLYNTTPLRFITRYTRSTYTKWWWHNSRIVETDVKKTDFFIDLLMDSISSGARKMFAKQVLW